MFRSQVHVVVSTDLVQQGLMAPLHTALPSRAKKLNRLLLKLTMHINQIPFPSTITPPTMIISINIQLNINFPKHVIVHTTLPILVNLKVVAVIIKYFMIYVRAIRVCKILKGLLASLRNYLRDQESVLLARSISTFAPKTATGSDITLHCTNTQ